MNNIEKKKKKKKKYSNNQRLMPDSLIQVKHKNLILFVDQLQFQSKSVSNCQVQAENDNFKFADL